MVSSMASLSRVLPNISSDVENSKVNRVILICGTGWADSVRLADIKRCGVSHIIFRAEADELCFDTYKNFTVSPVG
jgi:ribose 5-phosphate isomerase RpiB